MKFFIITRDDYDYDEYDAHVVRAKSKEDALKICDDEAFTKENSTIKEVTLEGGAGIILSSFNAG